MNSAVSGSQSFRGASLAIRLCLYCAGNPPQLYVDCSRADDGNGSLHAPWNTLEGLNGVTLHPGDTVHLRRGDRLSWHAVTSRIGRTRQTDPAYGIW